jgi:hypothetical protein
MDRFQHFNTCTCNLEVAADAYDTTDTDLCLWCYSNLTANNLTTFSGTFTNLTELYVQNDLAQHHTCLILMGLLIYRVCFIAVISAPTT